MKTKKQEFIDNLGITGVGIELLDEVINQANAEHEASKWKKYPENKPESGISYLVTKFGCVEVTDSDDFDNAVIAFRELTEPYKPE